MDISYKEFLNRFASLSASSQNLTLDESRKASKQFFAEKSDFENVDHVFDTTIDGIDGNLILLRIFSPQSTSPLPVIVFFHHGGWAFGSVDEAEPLCRKLAKFAHCIVVAVEYRLAPENKFPKGLEDCYAATKWVWKNCSTFGGNPNKIVVCGESAGANLAASVAMMCRDQNEQIIAYQILLYPVLTNDLDRKQYESSPDKIFITYDAMQMFWNLYVNSKEDGDTAYASPLKAKDFTHLPPAAIITGGYDPLNQDGKLYADKLSASGVKVEQRHYEEAIHAFLSLPIKNPPHAEKAIKDICEMLNRNLKLS